MVKVKKIVPLEYIEQKNFITWCHYDPEIKGCVIHIPNGGKRSITEAIRFKNMGVKAGVPDIFIPIPVGNFHGLWIELKRSNGKDKDVSLNQAEWILKLQRQGYYVAVAFGCEHAIEITKFYLSHEKK